MPEEKQTNITFEKNLLKRRNFLETLPKDGFELKIAVVKYAIMDKYGLKVQPKKSSSLKLIDFRVLQKKYILWQCEAI